MMNGKQSGERSYVDQETIIKMLEGEWDLENGFLGKLRQGEFDASGFERLIGILKSVDLPNDTSLEKRFVALTWYIPIFLTWEKERFIEEGKEVVELDHAINRIVGLLENILGIP
jgi:hypothetical protein